jgi:AcrR family transcriptional regulator
MIKQRMSRKESQLQTRERLLDAALEVFSRRGYSAASVDEVAAEAGFSKGAVYSNFSSKEDLFLALIDRRLAADVQGYPGIIHFMTDSLKPEKGPNFKQLVMQDRTWNILLIEFFLFAIRDETNREKLAMRLDQFRRSMQDNLVALYRELDKKPMLPAKELPWSVFSLGVGMMLQLFIDSEKLPDGVYERALQQLLR